MTQEEVHVYGPYHRTAYASQRPGHRGQTAEVMRDQIQSGELHGEASRLGGAIPAAKAHRGSLGDRVGFEFYTFVPPDSPNGQFVYWRPPPYGLARLLGDWAIVNILITRVSQEF